MSMSEDKPKTDLAKEFLAHMQMNETTDYVARGRPLRELADQGLADIWVASFQKWFSHRSDREAQTARR